MTPRKQARAAASESPVTTKRPAKAVEAGTQPELRLKMELIPKPLWGQNLRAKLGKAGWSSMRDTLTARQGRKCATPGCGNSSPLYGHEVWDYAEKEVTGTATLRGVRMVCQDCHSIVHFGRFQSLLVEKAITKKEYDRVIAHALRINACGAAVWEQHGRETKEAYDRRSKLNWTVDWGPLKPRGGSEARR
jgi:hypothetical protein